MDISTKKNEWGTPLELFNELDKEFEFTLDPCGNPKRLLRPDLLTLGILGRSKPPYHLMDGLNYSWKGESVFCNPPYSGRGTIAKWIKNGFDERGGAEFIVFLIPVRTDRNFFHDYVKDYAEIRFLKQRPEFIPLAGQNLLGVPAFPSMLIIYRGD